MFFVHPQWSVTAVLCARLVLIVGFCYRIIDCVKLRKRLPFQPYVFESADEPPPIMRPEWHADPERYPSQHMTNMLKQRVSVEKEQALGWGSVLGAEKMASGYISSTLKKDGHLFDGKKIILGCQIEVSPDFRVAIESTVVAAGGNVLPEERMRDCDIYITPFREGKEYLRVSSQFLASPPEGVITNFVCTSRHSGFEIWQACRDITVAQPCSQDWTNDRT